MRGVACDHDLGCITCGDVAVPLTVLKVRHDHVALCRDVEGSTEEVDVSLLERVQEGDRVLVHARVALAVDEP